MTDLDVASATLLATVIEAVTDAETAGGLRRDICEGAIDAGYEYARFEPVSGDAVECGSRPDGDHVDTSEPISVSHGGRLFGTLTLEPPRDGVDLDAVGRLAGYGLSSIESADLRENRIEDQDRKVQKLHSIAARMADCTDPDEVFHLGMDAAENILEFDISSMDVVEHGWLVPQVVSTGLPATDSMRLPSDEGIGGQTYQENRTIMVDDLKTHPKGNPENPEFRALLSVPIDGHGVFQAGAREVGAFDETDARLAELLMTHVSQSLDRIESAAALRESEEKYRTLVEQSHDAVVIYQAGELVFANARAENLMERGGYELVGTSRTAFVHPNDGDAVARAMEDLDTAPEDHTTYEARLLTPDGSHRHCECSASLIRYQGEDATLVSIRDITDRKRRQRELERQNERLEEFANVVSHDLRNPLNVARGSLDLAEHTGENAHFERTAEALARMEDLVEGVLDLARQGKLVDETEHVLLPAVVERSWRTVDSPDASLEVSLDDVCVDADPLRLQELLENLFRNAVEHGGDDVTVTVEPLPDGDGFAVSDDGPGIPADERESIFQRGYSTGVGGTGFGLAIVESIADAHGWTIDAVEADGARFEVRDVSLF